MVCSEMSKQDKLTINEKKTSVQGYHIMKVLASRTLMVNGSVAFGRVGRYVGDFFT
jgi:hypothetical protein